MAKKELLGHVGPCVCCNFMDMEVRADRNGNPYAYCPDCSAQVLTHGRPERVKPMLARMRPVVVAPAPAAPSGPEVVAPVPAAPSVMESKQAEPKPAPVAKAARPAPEPKAPEPKQAPARPSPFATLIG